MASRVAYLTQGPRRQRGRRLATARFVLRVRRLDVNPGVQPSCLGRVLQAETFWRRFVTVRGDGIPRFGVVDGPLVENLSG